MAEREPPGGGDQGHGLRGLLGRYKKEGSDGSGSQRSGTMMPGSRPMGAQASPRQMPMQGSSRQMPMQGSPRQMQMTGSPRQMPMPGSPRQMPMPGSPRQMPMQGSPRQMPMQGSPRLMPMQGSPKLIHSSPRAGVMTGSQMSGMSMPGSPRPMGAQGSPRQATLSGSSMLLSAPGSPRPAMGMPGSPRPIGAHGSPRQAGVPGSPRPMGAQGSPRQMSRAGPQRPGGIPGSPGSSTATSGSTALSTPAAMPTRQMSELSISSELELPLVKFEGKKGRPVEVACNYIKLEKKHDSGVHEYAVSFSPGVDNRRERFRLLKQPEVTLAIGHVQSFDGTKLFLPFKTEESHLTIEVGEPGNKIVLTLRYKRERNPCEQTAIQHYNFIFSSIMRILSFTPHNKKYFDPKAGHKITAFKLEVWPGYVTAVNQYEDGLFLHLDVANRVIRTETVLDIVKGIVKKSGARQKEEIEKALLGMIVLTQYNNKSYKIDDIAWDTTPMSTFVNSRGEEMTFYQYYKNHHNIEIRDKNQIMLVHKAKARSVSEEEITQLIVLVPELCLPTGLTDAMRQDFKLMKSLAEYTRLTPDQRVKAMENFIRNVHTNEEARKQLTNWGLELSKTLVRFGARQLDSETLLFGRGQTEKINEKGEWNRAALNKPFLKESTAKTCAVLYLKRDSSTVEPFVKMLKDTAFKMGLKIEKVVPLQVDNDSPDAYVRRTKAALEAPTSADLILCAFPNIRSDRYAAVKKLCCVEKPVASQVVLLKTISNQKRLQAVAQKIAIQINCKLGGEAWGCEIPFKRRVMVIGINVFRDASKKDSFVGMVSTTNSKLSTYFSRVVKQPDKSALMDVLRPLFYSTLTRFHELNGGLPDNIVIFRDGVGDGQFEMIQNHEADQFFQALKDMPKELSSEKGDLKKILSSYKPGITYVVVLKKISTRILGITGPKNYANPRCGIVVDHTITRRNYKDFFLVPMSVAQGTATPTQFVIIRESEEAKEGGRFKFQADHVQKLAYMLTHMYFNWSGTVRVPSPCQYARKLVDLVGEYLHRIPNDALNDKLYYL